MGDVRPDLLNLPIPRNVPISRIELAHSQLVGLLHACSYP